MEASQASDSTVRKPLTNSERQSLFRARNMMRKKQPIGLWGRHGKLTHEEAVFAVNLIEKELNGGNVATTSWVQELVSFFLSIFSALNMFVDTFLSAFL
jgi:hypothetical protein